MLVSNKALYKELRRINDTLGMDEWLLFYVVMHLNGYPANFVEDYSPMYQSLTGVTGGGSAETHEMIKQRCCDIICDTDRELLSAVAIVLLDKVDVCYDIRSKSKPIHNPTVSASVRQVVKEIFINLIYDSDKLFPTISPEELAAIEKFSQHLLDGGVELTPNAKLWLMNAPKDHTGEKEYSIGIHLLHDPRSTKVILWALKSKLTGYYTPGPYRALASIPSAVVERFLSIQTYTKESTGIDTMDLYYAGLISSDEI